MAQTFNNLEDCLDAMFKLFGNGASLASGSISAQNYVADNRVTDLAASVVALLQITDSILFLFKDTPLGAGATFLNIGVTAEIIRTQQQNGSGIDSSNVVSLIADVSALGAAGSLAFGPAGIPVFIALSAFSILASVYATYAGVTISAANNLLLTSTSKLDGFNGYKQATWALGNLTFNEVFYKNPVTLPLLALMYEIDRTITPEKALSYIENSGVHGVEFGRINESSHLLNSLVKMFFGGDAGNLTSQEAINSKINEVWNSFKFVAGQYSFTSPPTSGSEARNDLGAFLSLYYLTPFAIKSTDAGALDKLYQLHATLADQWNADRNLTSVQIANSEANFSDTYLTDRAEMLKWVLKSNADNTFGRADGLNAIYEDKASGIELSPIIVSNTPMFIFGSNNDDAGTTAITGGNNADHLYGMAGNDNINGGDGNDHIEGGAGQDTLKGEAGNDTLIGGADVDILDGGTGNDILKGGAGVDVYQFNGAYGFDTIIDSDGQGFITLSADITAPGSPLNGGGQIGDNRVYQSNDKQHIYTYLSGNSVDGGDLLIDSSILIRDHKLNGTANLSISFAGTAAADVPPDKPTTTRDIFGDLKPKDIDPTTDGIQTGSDDLGNYIFTTTAEPGSADDLKGSAGNDHIKGLGGGDYLYGNAGDDYIEAGAGDDYVNGGVGKDYIEGGAGKDNLFGQADNDYIDAGAGTDWVYGGTGKDILLGGDDTDILSGGTEDDRLYAGSEVISVQTAITNGNTQTGSGQRGDWLAGGEGDDTLIGDTGNDVLSGGAGKDTLIGGAGDDDILGDVDWQAQSFNWTVTDTANERLFQPVLGEQYPVDAGADLIYAGNGNDHVYAGQGNDIVYGEGNDDTILGEQGNDILIGGYGNDSIYGDAGYLSTSEHGDDILYGGVGIDKLYGQAGNDYLDGGENNDTLYGGAGNDTLLGGLGDDKLYGDSTTTEIGNDFLSGGAGNDTLAGADGNDTLQGGADQDQLYGGDGNDVLIGTGDGDLLVGGAGQDVIYAGNGDRLGDRDDGDNIFLAGSNNASTVSVIKDTTLGSTVLLLNIGGDQSVIINLGISATGDATYTFSDGSHIKHSDLLGNTLNSQVTFSSNLAMLFGGKLNDTLTALGTTGSTLFGGLGNDTLLGGDGNDTLKGGAGDDMLYGGGGGDYYYAETGGGHDVIHDGYEYLMDDTIYFNISPDQLVLQHSQSDLIFIYGNDSVVAADWFGGQKIELVAFRDVTYHLTVGSDGNDAFGSYLGNNYMDGGPGNDTLQGGTGYNVLIGGLGDDYLMTFGNSNSTMTGGQGSDLYRFVNGIGHIQIDNTATDNATTYDWLYLDNVTSSEVVLSRVGKDLLVTVNVAESITIKNYYASVNNKIDSIHLSGDGTSWSSNEFDMIPLVGTTGNDVLVGTPDGSSVILGMAGNDLLTGGIGYDHLDGGTGNDSLLGGLSDDHLDGGTGNDSLLGGLGDDNYIVDSIGDIVIENLDEGDDSISSTVTYTLSANVEDLHLIGTDSINGTGNELNNYLFGNEATNVLAGGAGNDWLVGGLGDDLNLGGLGNDEYGFYLGDGHDQIDNTATDNGIAIDMLYLGDIAPTNVVLSRVSDDLLITISTTDSITIKNYYVGNNQIDLIQFSYYNAITDAYIQPVWDRATFEAIVSGGNVNHAPEVATAITSQTTLEDSAYNFTVLANAFSDVDVGDTLTYSTTLADGTALPSWLSFNAATRTYSGTPLNEHVGNLSLKVTATDIVGASANQTFGLTVINTNDAPVVATVIAAQSTLEDSVFSFTIPTNAFADVDVGDTLTYSTTLADGTALPSWLTFNAATRTYSGTPLNENVGNLSLKVTATDIASASANQTFGLTVINTNDAPTVATVIAAQSTLEDSVFSFTIPMNAFADVDVGDTLTYSTTLADGTALPSWLSFNAATRTYSGTPLNEHVGNLSLKVTATDIVGASANQTFGLTVINTNDAPVVATVIAAQSTLEDSVFSFTIPTNAFGDVDVGDTLTYSATLADGSALPTWLTFNAATRTYSGTPLNQNVGNLSLKITATDTAGASAKQTFGLTVFNTNDAPVLAGTVANQLATDGSAFSWAVPTNLFTDVDVGDKLTYSVVQSNGSALPSWLSFNALTATLQGTPGAANIGSLSLKVVATDIAGAAANTTFSLAVGAAAGKIITGTSGNDILTGDSGNDILNGLAGSDTMIGGLGNDTYTIDVLTDVVIENLNEGTDLVNVAVTTANGTYTLAANIEDATLINTVAFNLTGNLLANTLIGNAAANILDGGLGADAMIGGLGNDIYVVDNIGDVVTETSTLASEIDLVQSSVSYSLGANLEVLTLTGSAAINGTGNALNNLIVGNAANNILDGGLGADTMVGGLGNDTYLVDNSADTVIETSTLLTEIDTVQANINYTLGINLENLILTGLNNINATGNALNNTITGNAANNVLNGLAGNDIMIGGLGNDTYTIDVLTDVITENLNEGTDLVNVAVATAGGTYTVAANVENATLTNTVAYSLTGNALDNVLTGNAAANTLNGGAGNDTLNGLAGNDTMIGGIGNDTYTIDVLTDVITENLNEGTDLVNINIATASGTYTVAANVENAILNNTIAYSLIGNALNNFMLGNAANNTLTDTAGGNDLLQGLAGADTFNDTVGNNLFDGGAGNDTITGGAGRELFIGGTGNDTITTGAGFDVISFNKGDGADIINASTGADNTLSLGGNFAYSDLSLNKSTNDLILKMGATDQITLKNWYLTSPTNKSVINLQVVAEAIQGFTLGGADQLRNNKIENFNFANLVAAFDTAGATANWQLTDARLTTHLLAGSDTAAIGGDLAYQYGKNSNLTGMGSLNAQSVIAAASFGQTAQTLNNPTVWQAEVVKLG